MNVLQEFTTDRQAAIHRWLSDVSCHRQGEGRKALLQSFPMLAAILSTDTELPIWRELAAMVDRGDEVASYFSATSGISLDSLQFIRDKGPSLLGSEWLENPLSLLWAIQVAPKDKLPTSDEEWRAFRSFWCASNLHRHDAYREPSRLRRQPDHLAEHIFRGLCQFGYARGWLVLEQVWPVQMVAMQSLWMYRDFVGPWIELEATTGQSCRQRGTSFKEVVDVETEFLMRYDPFELFRQAHRLMLQFDVPPGAKQPSERVMGDDATPGSWRTLPVNEMHFTDMTIRCLDSSSAIWTASRTFGQQLRDEAESCHSLRTQLLVLSDAAGTDHVAAHIELERRDGGMTARIGRVVAKDGHVLPAAASETLTKVIEYLNDPARQEDLARCAICSPWTEFWCKGIEAGWSPGLLRRTMRQLLPDYRDAVAWILSHC